MRPALRFSTARQVFEAFPPAKRDIETAPTEEDPTVFLKALLASATPEDAISFCAYVLPRRQAVWWGCQCVRKIESPLPTEDEQLIARAEAWVENPDEEVRRAVQNEAARAERQSTALWLALAAAWSGGSLAGPEDPPLPPAPYLTARAVRAAVLTSLARVDRRERRNYSQASVIGALKLVDGNISES